MLKRIVNIISCFPANAFTQTSTTKTGAGILGGTGAGDARNNPTNTASRRENSNNSHSVSNTSHTNTKSSQDNWNTSKYQYDETKYNPDSIDSVPAAQLYDTYLNVCALGSKSSGIVSGLGKIQNSGGVKNVGLGGMNRKKACLANSDSIMDSIMDTFGNVVNQTFQAEQSAGGLYLPGNGSEIDNLAEYLRDYAKDHSDEIFSMGGLEAFNMNEFGNYVDSTGSENAGSIPYYQGSITDENGAISQEYKDYVYSFFYDDQGHCLYPNVDIKNIKINPANGNVQVEMKSDEESTYSASFTVTVNPTNPQALANGYVSIPGTGGGDCYAGIHYYGVVNNMAYKTDSRYMIASFTVPPSRYDVADATIAAIFDKFTGEDNKVNKAVVSGASAGGLQTIDSVRKLKDVTEQPVDIMLIDAASLSPSCSDFTNALLKDSNKDVLDYLKQGSVIIAYESLNQNGGPAAAEGYLQQVADTGVKVAICVNSKYPEHTNVEYQILAGEVDRVMSGFEEFKGNDNLVTVSSTSVNRENPYIEGNPNMTQYQRDKILKDYQYNNYGILTPGGDKIVSGKSIINPVDYSVMAEFCNPSSDDLDPLAVV